MAVKIITFLLFGAAAIVGVWDLLQIEAFNNALIQFATAGVVPGIRTPLTPGQMYVVLSAILVIAICLLFRRELVRDIKGMRTLFAHDLTHSQPAVSGRIQAESAIQASAEQGMSPALEPQVQRQPPVKAAAKPAKEPKPAKRKEKLIILATIPAQPGRIIKAARFVKPRFKPAVKTTGQAITAGSRAAWRWTVQTTIVADRKSRAYAADAWRYAEPRIRGLDKQIEQALKANPKTAKVLRIIEREYTATAAQYAGWRAKNHRAVEKQAPEEI